MIRKAKKYFDGSRTVKKWGAGAEKIPTALGNARRNLANTDAGSWYGKTGKWTGVSLLLALQALTKSIKILGVDNLMLRAVEIEFSKIKPGKNKKGGDKKFYAFIKKHPWIPAYIVNYMFLAGVLFGTNVGGVRDAALEKMRYGIENLKDYFSGKDKSNMLSETRTGAEWCETDFINALCVAVPLVFEECYTTAKKTAERGGVYNIGYCMTSMPADKDNPYGGWRRVRQGDTCTEEQAAAWAQIYNQKNIFPTIREKLKVEVSAGMILALADLSYNTGAMGIMIARLNDGWTEQQVLDKMLEYRSARINGKLRVLDGLVNRCWWRYAVGSNAMDYDMLLDCRLTAVSHVGSGNLYADPGKYSPVVTDESMRSVLTASVPNKPTVRDIFGRSETGREYIAAIENPDLGKTEKFAPIGAFEVDSSTYLANSTAFEAQTAFDRGDYVTASAKFRKMIELVPDAYDSYNDLIFTLYKIGNYDEGLRYARILIDMGHENDVTEDNVFGAAYFNAGLCREAKGELEMARANFSTAAIRMPNNKEIRDAVTRINEKIRRSQSRTNPGGR